MASYHCAAQSEPPKMEQIITEFFAKSLHIILETRCPYVSSRNYSGEQSVSSPSSTSSPSSSSWSRDKWFNLALKDCPAALENIDFWRQSNLEPMIVDVFLVQRQTDLDPVNCSPRRGIVRMSSKDRNPYWSPEHDEYGSEARSEKIIERWVVHYEKRKSGKDSGWGSKRSSCNSWQSLYKKSTLLFRSLYATVRLLPAYKLFRELNSSPQIRTFGLGHRVCSFVEPFTRREEAEMQRFAFSPVETSCGRLCLSVLYRSALSDVSSEPSTPMSPQFIPDYVGSPMADPLKRFPSVAVPQSTPSSSFTRRHSWSYDLYRASSPSAFPSPSPTYSESRASISKPNFHRLPPTSLPRHLLETPQSDTKTANYDEYWPSPNFSPSPSPSPPTYIPGIHASRALLRCESAPDSISASKLSNAPHLANKQILPPSPPLRTTRSNVSKADKSLGLFQTSSTVEKSLSFGRYDPGKISALKISSNSSPQKSFSRSSSRLSFQDDYDDSEFSGPFVVDDVDMTDPGSRLQDQIISAPCKTVQGVCPFCGQKLSHSETFACKLIKVGHLGCNRSHLQKPTMNLPASFDQTRNACEPLEPTGICPVSKSQDAAVGALVYMLKKAAPLRQDFSDSTNLLQVPRPELYGPNTHDPNQIHEEVRVQQAASLSIASSGLLAPKTTADALEELRGYREMKDLLLRERGRSQT